MHMHYLSWMEFSFPKELNVGLLFFLARLLILLIMPPPPFSLSSFLFLPLPFLSQSPHRPFPPPNYLSLHSSICLSFISFPFYFFILSNSLLLCLFSLSTIFFSSSSFYLPLYIFILVFSLQYMYKTCISLSFSSHLPLALSLLSPFLLSPSLSGTALSFFYSLSSS